MLAFPLIAFTFLAGSWQVAGLCPVPADQQPLVTSLLRMMVNSIGSQASPNPSILIALRLARNHSLAKEQQLLQALKDDAINRVKNGFSFTSGEVALYVMAISASCQNPAKVPTLRRNNLVKLLSQKLNKELEHLKNSNSPLTNFYQIGLAGLALCQQNREFPYPIVHNLISNPGFLAAFQGPTCSVDTAAVVVLALTCIKEKLNWSQQQQINTVLRSLVGLILKQQQGDGTIGNIYSTGLAVQALSVSSTFYSISDWNYTQSIQKLLSEIPKGTFQNPMAASQAVPSLEERTYFDVTKLQCSQDSDNLDMTYSVTTATTSPPQNISVEFTVTNSVANNFTDSITVSVPAGSVLLRVMEEAQRQQPAKFSFTTQQTSWGPYVTSIQGVAGNNNDKTYWEFLSGSTPLTQGVGDYVPFNGEHIIARFTTY